MRITTWNVNGMRAALKKGFAKQIEKIQPDVLLLQEVRATPEQLPEPWAAPPGWHVSWHPAERPGYAGTAVWSREPHRVLERGIGEPDPEGRVIRVSVSGVQCVSVYLPSGSSSPERQAAKEVWMERFRPWADRKRRARGPVILGGDLNIAHAERDLYYAKSNQKQSGFLPHERAWIGELFGSGWRDVVREGFPDQDGPYTWWSNRGRARELDRGWRIDYLLANAAGAKRVQGVKVHRKESLGVSDHAPVSVDLK